MCYHISYYNHDQIPVLQSGHNIEKVREKMGELIKQMINIYSLPKLIPYILEGLRSKNNRTRIECVDIVGYFIDHHGTEVWIGIFTHLSVRWSWFTYRRCLVLSRRLVGWWKTCHLLQHWQQSVMVRLGKLPLIRLQQPTRALVCTHPFLPFWPDDISFTFVASFGA